LVAYFTDVSFWRLRPLRAVIDEVLKSSSVDKVKGEAIPNLAGLATVTFISGRRFPWVPFDYE
jgi:hypothetical protein